MTETSAKGNPLTRGERLQIMLDAAELRAIDDFRFASRMPSRAAAIRELLKRGLAAEGFAVVDGTPASRSFGVIEHPLDAGNGKAGR